MVDNNKSLLDSVKRSNLTKARILLENGANPNLIDVDEGVSPMHIAAGMGIESLCLLLQFSGDPNVRTEDGTTPVHVSSIWGVGDCMQLLLANGGDPYLTDQDGLCALDFAAKYQHDDVIMVLKQYKCDLNLEEEQTMAPKYTLKRLSSESVSSQNSSITSVLTSATVEDSRQELKRLQKSWSESTEVLGNFRHCTHRRNSALYLQNIQQQMDKYIKSGNRTHLVDVTSPDHPYVGLRCSCDNIDNNDDDTINSDDSLCLHLSTSTIEDKSSDSNMYVTCNEEDLETMIQRSPGREVSNCYCSPLQETEKKNPKYLNKEKEHNSSNRTNDSIRNGQDRTRKYCRRVLEPVGLTQDLIDVTKSSDRNISLKRNVNNIKPSSICVDLKSDENTIKCDYCDSIAAKYIEDSKVCLACEELGYELDKLVYQSVDDRQLSIDKSVGKNRKHVMINTKNNSIYTLSQCSESYQELNNSNNGDDDNDDDNDYGNDDGDDDNDKLISSLNDTFLRTKLDGTAAGLHESDFQHSDIPCSTRISSSDDQHYSMKDMCATGTYNRINDSILSSVNSTVNDLDKGCIWSDSILTTDDTFIDQSTSPKFCTKYAHSVNNDIKGNVKSGFDVDQTLNIGKDDCLELNELWTQVEESKRRRLATKNREAILNTGFCGRESLGSMYSDGSTIDYMYTDKEHGITLVERHIPSICGSQGSRRSIDSLFSANNDINGGDIDSSQDTVLYNWRNNAMAMSHDSGHGESCQTDSQSTCCNSKTDSHLMSQDLLKLDNLHIHKKQSCHGNDPGPDSKATRQCYLKRLSKIETDPNYNIQLKKSSEYPLELRQALSGNLDLSDMIAMELKMVAAFQNPDRHRRWREGTLKSSFNYILLDPRITKNLPNRFYNMSKSTFNYLVYFWYKFCCWANFKLVWLNIQKS
ncbi:Ankyrin repeat and LEM [Mactra antiquata]